MKDAKLLGIVLVLVRAVLGPCLAPEECYAQALELGHELDEY
jgi:hypothetical protein